MKRSVITLLSVVAVLLASSAASAEETWWPQVQSPPQQVMGVHFDDDELGAVPATAPMSPVMTKFGYLGDWNGDPPADTRFGTFAVENVAGMNKAYVATTNYNGIDSSTGLVYNGYANLYTGTGWVSPNGGTASRRMATSFDIAVMAAPASMTNIAANSVFYLAPQEGFLGQRAYRFVAVPTSEGGGIFGLWNTATNVTTTFGTYTEGQKYNITLGMDYTNGTVDAYVDGAPGLIGYARQYGAMADPRGGWTRELWMTVNGSDGLHNQVALDNVDMYIPFAGDANMDSKVDVADLTNLLNNYNKDTGMSWTYGDFDDSGTVDVADLTALLNNYNKTVIGTLPPPALTQSMGTQVPEPSSIVLLAGLALTALFCWRRKRA